MRTVFLDTNVFLYSAGAAHPLQGPSRNVLRRVVAGDLQATTSSEVVQEILHVLRRRGLEDAALTLARNALSLFPDLLPVTRFDMVAACHLHHFEGIKGLRWLRLSEQ